MPPPIQPKLWRRTKRMHQQNSGISRDIAIATHDGADALPRVPKLKPESFQYPIYPTAGGHLVSGADVIGTDRRKRITTKNIKIVAKLAHEHSD